MTQHHYCIYSLCISILVFTVLKKELFWRRDWIMNSPFLSISSEKHGSWSHIWHIPIKTQLCAQGSLEVLANLLATVALFSKRVFLWPQCQRYVWLGEEKQRPRPEWQPRSILFKLKAFPAVPWRKAVCREILSLPFRKESLYDCIMFFLCTLYTHLSDTYARCHFSYTFFKQQPMSVSRE